MGDLGQHRARTFSAMEVGKSRVRKSKLKLDSLFSYSTGWRYPSTLTSYVLTIIACTHRRHSPPMSVITCPLTILIRKSRSTCRFCRAGVSPLSPSLSLRRSSSTPAVVGFHPSHPLVAAEVAHDGSHLQSPDLLHLVISAGSS